MAKLNRNMPSAASQMRKSDMPYDTQGMDPEMVGTLTAESRRKALVGRMTGNPNTSSGAKPKSWQEQIHDKIRTMLGLPPA